MSLEYLKVAGYKSIYNQHVSLRALNVLIGANGGGKSNFISLFKFLNQLVQQNLQLHVARTGGANAVLHYGSKSTKRLEIELKLGKNAYACKLIPTADDNFAFESETATFYGDYRVKPVSLGSGHRESKLDSFAKNDPIAEYTYDAMQSWRVYHFHDTSDTAPMKAAHGLNDNERLQPDASNLAAFLFLLQRSAPSNYEMIRESVRGIAPFFDDFNLRPSPENEGVIRLEWRERGSDIPFLAHQLSDGTLRFIALATLLLQPAKYLPACILIDEPELGLHPVAIDMLGGFAQIASGKTQVIMTTQSSLLLNKFEPEDVIVVNRRSRFLLNAAEGKPQNGYSPSNPGGFASTFDRLSRTKLGSWLEEYSLSDLWLKNVIEAGAQQ